MATTAKIARTDIPGAVPNVTDSANSDYIEPGALYINVADEILYSSNGTAYFQISGSGGFANSDFVHDTFNGNGSNTQFTLSEAVSNTEAAFIYLNGVAQVPTTDYSISGATLTFVTAPATTDVVHSIITKGTGTYFESTFIGNGTNTQFTLANSTTTSRTFVYLNGVTQVPTGDYYISGSDIIFYAAPANNDNIVVRGFSESLEASGQNTSVQFNDSGLSGGSLGFTFNKTTNNVSIANTLLVASIKFTASNPPANSSSSGAAGTIAWDSSYIYVCVATDTWKRVAIATWP